MPRAAARRLPLFDDDTVAAPSRLSSEYVNTLMPRSPPMPLLLFARC